MALDVKLDQLLQHRDFLKALARSLVADPLEQDELLWETMGEGAMRPPRHSALKPWLARVMRNQAKARDRAKQRRQAHERAGSKLNEIESAADLAARFELFKDLVNHVQALEPDYRDVVLFRFFEGLPPREIAERLALPIETVKKRLGRALAMLRARLDREHGSRDKWLGCLLPLAFPSVKATGVGITTVGVLLMATKTKVVLAGISALLLLGAATMLVVGGAAEPFDAGEVVSEPLDAGGVVLERPKGKSERRARESNPSTSGDQPSRSLMRLDPVVSGRCVALETGEPLRGVSVRLAPWSNTTGELTDPRSLPLETETDALGRFGFSEPLVSMRTYRISIRSERRLHVYGFWKVKEPGEELDLGEIRIARGCALSGIVMDAQGQAVDTIRVGLLGEAVSLPSPLSFAMGRTAVTGKRGTFAFQDKVAPGRYRISVQGGTVEARPEELVIGPQLYRRHVGITLSRLQTTWHITGVLKDEQGRPIRDASLWVPEGAEDVHAQSALDGSFRLKPMGTVDRQRQLKLRVCFDSDRYRDLKMEEPLHWGDKNVQVVALSAKRKLMTVEVSDLDTGEPVEHYRLRYFRTPRLRPRGDQRAWHEARRYPEGRCALDVAENDEYWIQIDPRDEIHVSSDFIRFRTGKDDPELLRLRLPRPVKQRVVVQHRDGSAVAGSLVQLVQKHEATGWPPISTSSIAISLVERYVRGRGAIDIVLGQAKTDENGIAVIRCLPSSKPCVARALGPGHAPALQRNVLVHGTSETTRIIVPMGARLRGRITPLSFVKGFTGSPLHRLIKNEIGPRISLVDVGDKNRRLPRIFEEPCFVDADGRFEMEDLPSGLWNVFLGGFRNQSGRVRYRSMHKPLTTVRLEQGKTCELTIDATPILPGQLSGVALVNGLPLADAEIYLEEFRQDPTGRWISDGGRFLKTDTKGRFANLDIDSMHYRIHLRKGGVSVPVGDRFEIAASQKVHRKIDYTSPRVRIHLVEQDGKTGIPHVRVKGLSSTSAGSFHVATDAEGWIELPLAPAGRFQLRVNPTLWRDARNKMTFVEWQKLEVQLAPIEILKTPNDQVFTRKIPPR